MTACYAFVSKFFTPHFSKFTSALVIILLLFNNNAHAQWTRKADELVKRAEANNVIYHNKMYVFGGFGDNPVIEKTNEVYDIAKNKWSVIASVPSGKATTHQGVVLIDDNIWMIGGRAVDAHGPVTSQVIIYNIPTNTWKSGPELIDPSTGQPFPIGAGGYILLGRTLHVFGGFGPTICEDQSKLHLTLDIDKYLAYPQTTTWENKSAPLPYPRHHISYVTLAGKIYVFGGQFKHDCGAVDQKYCHVYDPLKDTWTRLTDLPVPRSHAEGATFAVDGKMFLVGGQGANDVTQNTVYQFSPAANNNAGSWTNLTAYKLPGNYLGLSSKIAGKNFIVTNGALNSSLNERKETYVANVTRSSARTFGFTIPCFSQTIDSGQETVIHNLLYTIEDTSVYHLASNCKWLTFSKKDSSGVVTLNGVDLKVTVNTSNLSPGYYSGKITAIGAFSNQTSSFCVNLNINAGNGYTLTISKTGSGSVTKTPDKSVYDEDSIVSLKAFPSSGWKFNGWGGDTTAITNPLSVTMFKNWHITATFIQDVSLPLITNIKATTGKIYKSGILSKDTVYYTDRAYKITSVPSYLNFAPFIKTPNDDKANKSTNALSFSLSKDATLYVGYDPRSTTLPAWLNGWTKLTDVIGINEPDISSFNLYSKDFPAGQVTLGGNLASPAAGATSEYIVIAVQKNTVDSQNMTAAFHADSINESLALNTNKVEVIRGSVKKTKPILYPNPAHNNLQIIFPDGYKGVSELRLTDLNGNVHNFNKSLYRSSGKVVNLNLSPLSLRPGIYVMLINSLDGKTDIINMIVQ